VREPGSKVRPETMTSLTPLLTAFAKGPTEIAAEYGKRPASVASAISVPCKLSPDWLRSIRSS